MTTRLTAREVLDRSIPEDGRGSLSEWFANLCKAHGALAYHPWKSYNSAKGYPDWTVVTVDHRIAFVELKKELGTLTPDQVAWGILLDGVAQRTNRVRYFVLRPSNRWEFELWLG